VDSIDQALAVCPKDQDTYIIGGGEIYTLGLPYADKLDITRVHHSFEADTYFQISILKFGNFLILCLIVKTIIMYDFTFQTFLRK
jgi:dihydrofolate reductase